MYYQAPVLLECPVAESAQKNPFQTARFKGHRGLPVRDKLQSARASSVHCSFGLCEFLTYDSKMAVLDVG